MTACLILFSSCFSDFMPSCQKIFTKAKPMAIMERMIPDLQASFACEDVRVEASGAHTIVGIVNFIGAPSLPIQVIKLCVWTRWSSGIGQFEQVTRLIAPHEETVLASSTTQFRLSNA